MRPRSPALLVLLAVAAGVSQAFGRFSYGLLLPAVNADLLHSYALAGLLGTLNLAAYLAGTLTVGLLAARAEPALLVRCGVAGSTLGLTVLAVAPNAAVLGVGMVVAGYSGAFVWVPAPSLAAELAGPGGRGMAAGVVGAGIGVCVVASSVLVAVAYAVVGHDSWRAVWGSMAVLGALVSAAASALLRLRVAVTGGVPVRMSALRAVPGWVGATVGYAVYGLALSTYFNFAVAALREGGFATGHAAATFLLIGVGQVVGGVLLGRLSDRSGRRPVLVGGYAAMAVAVATLPVAVEPLATLSALTLGVTAVGLPTVLVAHVADHLEPRTVGAAWGTLTLFFGAGQLLAPQVGGWLRDATGSFGAVFALATAAAAVGVAASARMPRAEPPVPPADVSPRRGAARRRA